LHCRAQQEYGLLRAPDECRLKGIDQMPSAVVLEIFVLKLGGHEAKSLFTPALHVRLAARFRTLSLVTLSPAEAEQ
jgi:hypothetical protein